MSGGTANGPMWSVRGGKYYFKGFQRNGKDMGYPADYVEKGNNRISKYMAKMGYSDPVIAEMIKQIEAIPGFTTWKQVREYIRNNASTGGALDENVERAEDPEDLVPPSLDESPASVQEAAQSDGSFKVPAAKSIAGSWLKFALKYWEAHRNLTRKEAYDQASQIWREHVPRPSHVHRADGGSFLDALKKVASVANNVAKNTGLVSGLLNKVPGVGSTLSGLAQSMGYGQMY